MKRVILTTTTFLLVACGGGSGSGSNSSNNSTYSVTAIDGYLQNAEVWLDLNENFQLDTDEPNALSGEGGVAILNVVGLANPEQYPVVVRAITGQTIDEDQGLVTTGYVMSAPAGETAITPLSTLVHVILKRSVEDTDTSEEIVQKKQSAVTQVSTQLGIESDDVLGDFIKSDTKDVIFAAENIVSSRVLPAIPSELASITDSNQAQADKFIQQTSVITREIKNVVGVSNPDFNTPVYNDSDDFVIDSDNDGYPDKYDAFPGDSTEFVDTDGDQIGNNADFDDDGDGLSDILEAEKNTNPLLSDTDGDGVNDLGDAFPIDANEALDTDNDGTGNNADTDDDGDGLSDVDEITKGSNSLLQDTDGDGVNDLNDALPANSSETLDTDSDGTGNNTDTDDDGDGVSDIDEGIKGSNPLLSDTDGDGVNDLDDIFPVDSTETLDTDGDGTGNNSDTDDDGDGISDIDEATNGSDPILSDTDGDGLSDFEELAIGSNPLQSDSDGDGVNDSDDPFPTDGTISDYGSGANLNLYLSANFNIHEGSSHSLQVTGLHINRNDIRTTNFGTSVHAVSYADFDQDGDVDVFMSSSNGANTQTPSELYLNDGANNFILDTTFFAGNPPGQVHPRKSLTGDFNGDNKMDIFVLGHGYDQPPYSGEAPYMILSSTDGFELGEGLDSYTGFHHGGASADIDADGDLDIFVGDTKEPFFLLNDGSAVFTKDTSRLNGLSNSNLFTAELVDIDTDGYVDLIVAGHEDDGFTSKVLWGDSTGYYSTNKSTQLPSIVGNGTVVDIDVADLDNDGDKDLILNRTGDGTGASGLNFYQGYYLQLIINNGNRVFSDRTTDQLNTGSDTSVSWFDWIRLQDYNGDGHLDIVVDDAARNLIWYNDGVGSFSKM